MKDLTRQIEYWGSVAGKKKFTHPIDVNRFRKLVPPTSSILDIGCGYGRICQVLYEWGYENVIGMDMSKEMIREGTHLFPHLDLRCLMSEEMPFQEDAFDVVIMFAVLTCIPTDKGQRNLIDSVLRVLKPNGLFYVSDYFLQKDRRNKIRYDAGHKKYNLHGVFELEDGAVLRHHPRPWVDVLLAPFKQILLTEMEAPTMNGHQSVIFQYWGRKKDAVVE